MKLIEYWLIDRLHFARKYWFVQFNIIIIVVVLIIKKAWCARIIKISYTSTRQGILTIILWIEQYRNKCNCNTALIFTNLYDYTQRLRRWFSLQTKIRIYPKVFTCTFKCHCNAACCRPESHDSILKLLITLLFGGKFISWSLNMYWMKEIKKMFTIEG